MSYTETRYQTDHGANPVPHLTREGRDRFYLCGETDDTSYSIIRRLSRVVFENTTPMTEWRLIDQSE